MLTAAQVRADRTRQAAERARARGHIPRAMSAATWPLQAATTYATRLHAIANGAIERGFAPLLRALPGLVAQARAERGDASDWRADASHGGRSASAAVKAAAAAAAISPAAAGKAAADAAGDGSAHASAQLGRQVREVLGIDLAPDSAAKARAAAFVHENVKLITGITPKLAADVEALVLAGLSGGQVHEQLADAVKARMQIAIGRAELIAIDQVGKIAGQVAIERMRDLGVTHFIWRTARDERVRGNPTGLYPKAKPSHFARDGKRYAIDDPPVGAKGEREFPGVPIRCRCGAEPDLSTVLGVLRPAAPAPGGPVNGANTEATVEQLEAEAARLAAEVEAMLSGQAAPSPSPTISDFARQLAAVRVAPPEIPAPPPPQAAPVRGLGRLRDVQPAADTGHPQVPVAREEDALTRGVVVALATNADQGITESYRATIEHGGERMRAIVKPAKGSVPTRYHPDLVVREVAAHRVADLLGARDITPTTVEVQSVVLGRASAQAFIEGGIQTSDLTSEQMMRIDDDSAVRMRVFDFVMGNTDRHGGNVMWVDDGAVVKPRLIDNGYTLPTSAPQDIGQPWLRGKALDDLALTAGARDAIASMDPAAVATRLAGTGVELTAIQGTLYRIAMIKDDPGILDVTTGSDGRVLGRRHEAAADPLARLSREKQLELEQLAYRAVRDSKRRGRR